MTKYQVIIADNVLKAINKFPKNIRTYIFERFNKLKINYVGYKLVDSSSNKQLWELRCAHHRIYYTVTHGQIIVLDVVYDGTIRGVHLGNKNTQKADINRLVERHIKNNSKY